MYKNNFLFTEAKNGSMYDIATDTKRFYLHSTKDNSVLKVRPWWISSAFFISLAIQHSVILFIFFRCLFIHSFTSSLVPISFS